MVRVRRKLGGVGGAKLIERVRYLWGRKDLSSEAKYKMMEETVTKLVLYYSES